MAKKISRLCFLVVLMCIAALIASAQSFQVQCPTTTVTHPSTLHDNNSEPDYTGPTNLATNAQGFSAPTANVNGAIKCQQISGGDGFATMGDGSQTYLFAFGPLSGLKDMADGKPGTQFPNVFNQMGPSTLLPGDPAATDGVVAGSWPASFPASPISTSAFTFNGAIGLAPDADAIAAGLCTAPCLDGHVDTRQIMDVAVMNGNMPAPLMAIDEDDEFFLTLTNVGQVMRPDLFEQHTVHFHGYPNASGFYDGVPDASVAINIGGSFTYYYLAPDAGTYFWHCHITPPEHLQMGMVGQLYVRPRQDRVSGNLYSALLSQQGDPRTACYPLNDSAHTNPDILCSSPLPTTQGATRQSNKSGHPTLYAYNDGDGSTAYDVEYPLQIHGFDPNFHFVGMTFNPEGFVDMKDKYFLLNGRSYPDTVRTTQWVDPGAIGPNTASPFVGQPTVSTAMYTQSADGVARPSQPLNAVINIPVGGKALLRISDLDVSEYQTLASLGIPMHVIGINARLLRDMAGADTSYYSNSITLGGGESLDVILDASDSAKYPAGSTYFLYTPNLDHLSNDAENFGGLMTEVHICTTVDPVTHHGTGTNCQ